MQEVIIVGGGIAGLSCARELTNRGVDFTLITKDVGGRIKFSDDKVSYGALMVGSNYRHMSRYVERGRRAKKFKSYLYDGQDFISPRNLMLKYPFQFLKTLLLTLRFRSVYKKFQRRSEIVSQKQAIEENKYLRELYYQDAEEFVDRHGVGDFARTCIEPVMYGVMISRLSEQNAFAFMLMSLTLVLRGYNFFFDAEKFAEPFRGRVIIDGVVSVEKADGGYAIRASSGKSWMTRKVVVATPSRVSQELLHIPKIKDGRDVYVFHIQGKVRPELFKGDMVSFGYDSPVFIIIRNQDRSFLVYATIPEIDLGKFFEEWRVIAKTDWSPIYTVIGKILLDARQGEGLWMAGDHNILGMEDSFITGLYAANEICKTKQG